MTLLDQLDELESGFRDLLRGVRQILVDQEAELDARRRTLDIDLASMRAVIAEYRQLETTRIEVRARNTPVAPPADPKPVAPAFEPEPAPTVKPTPDTTPDGPGPGNRRKRPGRPQTPKTERKRCEGPCGLELDLPKTRRYCRPCFSKITGDRLRERRARERADDEAEFDRIAAAVAPQ